MFRTILGIHAVVLLLGAVALLVPANSVRAAEKSDAKVKVDVQAGKSDANGNQEVTLKLDIEKDWHLYANPVGNDLFEDGATRVTFLSGITAIRDARIEYPKGKKIMIAGDVLGIYENSITIKATVPRPKDGAVKVRIKVQACNEKTQKCLLPGSIEIPLP